MANITPYIDQIQNATYGEEVRSSIINALELVNDDNESYQEIKEAVVDAKDTIEEVAENISDQISTADGLATTLEGDISVGQQVKSELEDTTTTAQQTKGGLDSSIQSGTTLKGDLEDLVASGSSIRADVEASAQTATQKATEASQSATTAVQAKDETVTAKTTAVEASQTAVTKAGEASTSATTATQKATEAGQSAQTAVQAKDTAVTKATEAGQSAQSASQSAQTATQKAQEAVDSAQSVSASATQIQTNTADISAIKADFNYLNTNPIRKNVQMTSGKYIKRNGEIISGGNQLSISDYIPVEDFFTKIIAEKYNANISSLMYAVNFFDSSKNWLGGVDPQYGNIITTVEKADFPTGTAFIVLGNYDTQATPTHDQVYLSTYAFIINDRVDELENAMLPVNDSTKNVDYFADKTVVESTNIEYTTGKALSNASFAACNFVEVEPNTAYYVMRDNFKHNSAGNIAFYDGSKTYISGQGSNWTTWTTPANCKYVRFSNYIAPWTQDTFTWDGVCIVKGSIASALCETSLFENIRYSVLNGKKWACIGDSLTEINERADLRYWNYIIQQNNMEFLNYGVGGSGYINRQSQNAAFYQRAANIADDADIITIFGGVNDCLLSSADIGDVTDTGTTTWCGCVNALIDTIQTKYLFAPLGIISPLPCDWIDPNNQSNYDTQLPSDTTCRMSQFVDKLKTICALRGVPFLDLFHQSNMHPENADFNAKYYSCYSARTGDGLHPNSEGHKLFYRKIEKFIETLLAE